MAVVLRALAAVAVVLVLGGCSSSETRPDPFEAGDGTLGSHCQKSEDCASGFCVRLNARSGICSDLCRGPADCPTATNWACLPGASLDVDVCACRLEGSKEICGDGADNDCDGRVDDCRLCDGKPVADDDPMHCGACGNACSRSQQCVDGLCRCPVGSPTECGSGCVDTERDAEHCGACNEPCTNGQACRDGECRCPDPELSDYCPGRGCVDLSKDRANCGTCGQTCPVPLVCVDGECACPSSTSPDYCEGVGCVDFRTDSNHCGACHTACTLGQLCVDGECACHTAQSPDFCAGVGCIDTSSNAYHCGECGRICPPAQGCVAGACACPNAAEPDYCEGSGCVDLASNPSHCGACGNACPAGEICVDSGCACTAGKARCGDRCVDLQQDRNNCGECGTTCSAAELCVEGDCGCPFANHFLCGGVCVRLGDDPANCGACGNVCSRNERCIAGNCECLSGMVCEGECMASRDDPANCGACGNACSDAQYCSGARCHCFGSGLSACGDQCVALDSDEANCGACGRTCKRGESCSFGSCGCPYGQSYCAALEACIDLANDAAHCGACNVACDPTEICRSGMCRCASSSDEYCANRNACTSLMNDNQNCGACDRACPDEAYCSWGTCACDDPALTFCGAACFDLASDDAHCGRCDNACPAPFTCTGGTCNCPPPRVGPDVRVTTDSGDDVRPALASDGTHAALAYLRTFSQWDSELRVALLDADAKVVSDRLVQSFVEGPDFAEGPSLVWSGSEYALAWAAQGREPGDVLYRVKLLRLTAALEPIASAVTIAQGQDSVHVMSPSLVKGPAGYALAYGLRPLGGGASQVRFRKLGSDGSAPEPENSVEISGARKLGLTLAQAANGSFAVAVSGEPGVTKIFFNADGSRTLPLLAFPFVYLPGRPPGMVHDGDTWFAAFSLESARNLVFHRGTTGTTTQPLVLATAGAIPGAVLSVQGRALAVAYAQGTPTASFLRFQRFSLPTAKNPALRALHAPVDALPTQTLSLDEDARSRPGVFAMTPMGTGRAMVAWSDTRWGRAREIYAATIDAGACP